MNTLIDLSGDLFAVVSIYNSLLYVHIRRYSFGKYPTKSGICMLLSQWDSVTKNLSKKGTTSIAGLTMKKTSTGMKIRVDDRDKEILLSNEQLNHLNNRYFAKFLNVIIIITICKIHHTAITNTYILNL